MKKYLNILVDALDKKNQILDEVREKTDEQEKCLTSGEFSLSAYNEIMEQKGELIARIDKIDDGFTSIYSRISPELKKSTIDYTEELKKIQELVSIVSDKCALIQAKELRIRNMIERQLKSEQNAVSNYSIGKSDAARRYQKVMTKSTVTPGSIFINKKQ